MKYAERKAIREKYGSYDLTLAYTLIAHGRGRLHGNRRRLVYWDLPAEHAPAYIAQTGGTKIIDWTLELQQKWLDKKLAEYERHMAWLERAKAAQAVKK